MLEKRERPVKVDWDHVKNSIVKQLTETFRKYPNCFFTEHDIHSVLYNIAKEELQLKDVLTGKTSDKHRVMLAHHEYPTPFRCDMHGHSFQLKGEEDRTIRGGKYKRGHYDLVILNPKFVRNNKLDVVYGKDYQKFRSAMRKVRVEPLILACEVVFFPRVKKLPKIALKIIEQDTLKVKETLRYKIGRNIDFCKMGSVLVFTSHTAEEASDLKQQVTRLRKKHKLEVTLLTALLKEN